jgi:hypothetical protein
MIALLWLACAPDADPEAACTPATEADILEVRGDYYVCLEAQASCGPDGYPLAYGARYAERYLVDVRPGVSPQGQAFLDTVSVCLQQRMAEWYDGARGCDAIWDHGFASHPGCYVDSGFCDVDVDSQLAIAAAVDPEDQALPEQQAQVLAVAEACLAELDP